MFYYNQKEYEKALEKLEESLRIERRLGAQSIIATLLNNIGLIHNGRKEYDEALEKFEESLGIERRLGDQSIIACVIEQHWRNSF